MYHKISGIEKFYGKEGGRGRRECHDFPSKIFFVSVPKKIVGEPFSVSLISDIENIYVERAMSRFSVKNFMSSIIEKFRWVILLCFTKILLWKVFMEKRGRRREGGSRFFVKVFLSQCRKKS